MAYNYPPSAGFQPPGYGGFPGAPPNMGPPPNMGGAPGMSPPPGMNSAQSPAPGRPAGVPAQFQPPSNLPNINFSAPIIRLGVPQPGKPAAPYGGYDDRRGGPDASGNRGRMGLGADGGRQNRDSTVQAMTKEEVARTIFVGGLVDGVPDDAMLEEIFGAGRGLRRWSRVTNADGKPCDFGFAEYEDAASLEIATKLFEELELPLSHKRQIAKDEDGNVKKAPITVIVDPESLKYIDQWTKADADDFQFKLDSAREDLTTLITNITSGNMANGTGEGMDMDGDAKMDDGAQGDNAELITIPVNAEDELADVPADMREMVAGEIAAFRDRSIRRDKERLEKEEALEKAERDRSMGVRASRLASPPAASTPTGPAGTNGIPVGPRDRTIAGAPLGPKGYRGAQMPKDYIDGVAFVNGGADEDEDDSASDSELERRRHAKRDAELEKRYLDQERKWLTKEKAHFDAVARIQREDEAAAAAREPRQQELKEQLKTFDDDDDDTESRSVAHLFYRDRHAWRRERKHVRDGEARRDDRDRRDEARERDAEYRRTAVAKDMADDFLAQQAEEIEARSRSTKPERAAFSLNLGFGSRAAVKEEPDDDRQDLHVSRRPVQDSPRASSHRRPLFEPEEPERKPKLTSMAEVEGLLDDEDEAASTDRKPMRALQPLAAGQKMTDAERQEATRDLAASIPSDKGGLFAWPVKWEHVTETVVTDQVRPYVQKKIMEALGVQEELLVDTIEEIVRTHGTPKQIMGELEMLDEEEAEALVRRVWRMVVFYSESEARGLGG